MTFTFFDQAAIELSIQRINEILNASILFEYNAWPRPPLFNSALIEVMICLRNLMFHCDKIGSRIDFEDDINKTSKVNDITDLIKHVRDAVCHLESPNHRIGNNVITFNLYTSDADNDVGIDFGEQIIYLRRHIIRAFGEAKSVLTPLLPQRFNY